MDEIRTDANGRKYIYNEESAKESKSDEVIALRAQVETLKGRAESYRGMVIELESELAALKEQNALLTQAADSVAVQEPEGWKLVPIEPTKKMIEAARTHYESQAYTGAVSTYKAMLATAPTLDKE